MGLIRGNAARPTPYLPAYHPLTRPYYLDTFWCHFQGRPFPVAGLYGFATAQTDPGSTQPQLASSSALGSVLLTLKTGQGSYFVPGELIVVGDGGTNWQPFLVNAVNTDTLTVFPRVSPSSGWPANSDVIHGWGSTTHPAYAFAWASYVASVVSAKMRRSDAQLSIMPPNGAGTGHDLGSLADTGTVSGLANCPAGWAPLGTAANVTCIPGAYAVTIFAPFRSSHGLQLRSATASGSGIQTTVNIPVKPGTDYTLSFQGQYLSGTGFKVQVVDSATPSIVLGSYTIWGLADLNTDTLTSRTTIQFTAPGGTTGVAIQIVGQTAADICSFDDLRFCESRQSTLNDRYVLENPQGRPIVILGDSWTYQCFSQYQAAIQARLGSNVQVINAGNNGDRLDQMLARMTSQVLPYYPSYMILGTGLQNDMAQGVSQSTILTNLAAIIDTARQNGIIPIITGVAPTSNGASTALQTAHDLNDACRAQCFGVT